MGRTVSSELQAMLDLAACESQTTLDIIPVSASPLYFWTGSVDIEVDEATDTDRTYTPQLRKLDDLKQSTFAPPDRCKLSIQNVDMAIGVTVTAEDLIRAEGIVGRIYKTPDTNPGDEVWVELFRGEVRPVSLDENEAQIEILHDLAACGYCVGEWTLGENCQFVYKHAATCGYSGGETLCNKKRKSLDGCEGRANEFHFGGMEFPDIQVPSTPINPPPPPGGGGHHTCPHVDQWIPVSGPHGEIESKQAGFVRRGDWLYDPLTTRFERVKTARVVKDQPIWCVTSGKGVEGYSSFTHPVFPYRTHESGIKASEVRDGDALLLWRLANRELINHAVRRSFNTRELGDVVRIELESGHVYAYGNREDLFIVCHNAKPPLDV